MRLMLRTLSLTALAVALALGTATSADAQPGTYRVTITNLTQHQVLSPPVVATHAFDSGIFSAGGTADMGLRLMAEDGDASALVDRLEADPRVGDVVASPDFLMPGHSVTLTVQSTPPHFRLSAVGMLVTTNDAFFGLDNHPLTAGPWLQSLEVPAYDAGTEANNEDCDFIPGPPCGNAGVRDTGDAEGFIAIHPGIHGIADVDPVTFDWRNPVAEITVHRMNR